MPQDSGPRAKAPGQAGCRGSGGRAQAEAFPVVLWGGMGEAGLVSASVWPVRITSVDSAVPCLCLALCLARDAQGRKRLPPGAERSDKEVVWRVALDWLVCISKVCSQSSHLLFLGIHSPWEGQSLSGQ